MIILYQLLTILFLLLLVILFRLYLKKDVFLETNATTLWTIGAQRVETAKYTARNILGGFIRGKKLQDVINLEEETFILGNGWFDDLYVDTSGKRVKLFLNIQRDQVLLSVIRGKIKINNQDFRANRRTIIKLEDMAKVKLDDVLLIFKRR